MKELFGERRFGFGCMRLPMKDGEVDLPLLCEMVDTFIGEGFTYFDTAHGYLKGKSETALRAALTSRYPRDSYLLTNKLSTYHFERQEEIRPLFFEQLRATGVDYFDFYLMHAQDRGLYEKFRAARAYETALELKAEGGFRHFGISFHDGPELLSRILTDYPEVEVVQLQYNYIDEGDPVVRAQECLAVAREFGKPVIVMEPVKGGGLAHKLPPEAQEVLASLGDASAASYALRFAAEAEGVAMVLSGMGDMAMLRDNLRHRKDPLPLTAAERAAVARVVEILRAAGTVPCTACEYCEAVCPQGIPIPKVFAALNSTTVFQGWNARYYYSIQTKDGGRASSCIGCGACEGVCPQHLGIRELLKRAATALEG